MSIKSDKWIRRMAEEHKMIEPFEPGQVKEVNGQRVVSYGTSSYGYDVRCADEFKLFTNIYSAIVDPKNFDPKSFVDVKNDFVIIPPNSFALARTVEYFRIPRNVLTVCLGKSTYARCFRGDTRVALASGSSITLEKMARRAGDGEIFYGYSVDSNGKTIVTKLEHPRFIGRDSLIELTLENESKIYCTLDHKFMTWDGKMKQAGNLRPNDLLMPFSRSMSDNNKSLRQTPTNLGNFQTSPSPCQNNLREVVAQNAATFIGNSVIQKALENTRRVTHIREIAGNHDVYCLTVPDYENFALEAGVFVHNCGIIVNVTPFEPEWEGYVTLEFSNTTPMPAKIYANEGVAQVIFFESDEVCDVSYKDRNGKYQGQQGVMPPKL